MKEIMRMKPYTKKDIKKAIKFLEEFIEMSIFEKIYISLFTRRILRKAREELHDGELQGKWRK